MHYNLEAAIHPVSGAVHLADEPGMAQASALSAKKDMPATIAKNVFLFSHVMSQGCPSPAGWRGPIDGSTRQSGGGDGLPGVIPNEPKSENKGRIG